MSFAAILRGIVDECAGGLGAVLMGADGIPIDQVEAVDRLAEPVPLDLTALGVEIGRVLDELRKVSSSAGGGAPTELTLRMERFWVVLRVVDEDNYLIVALRPEGNVGKARFLMRRQLLALRDQL